MSEIKDKGKVVNFGSYHDMKKEAEKIEVILNQRRDNVIQRFTSSLIGLPSHHVFVFVFDYLCSQMIDILEQNRFNVEDIGGIDKLMSLFPVIYNQLLDTIIQEIHIQNEEI